MFKLATLLALLPAIALASPVSADKVVQRDDTIYIGTAEQYTPVNFIPGACGYLNSPSDYVVGIASAVYGTGVHCGDTITITNSETFATVDAVVVEDCQTCQEVGDIEVTLAVATQLNSGQTPDAFTTFDVTWEFD